jgi:hypothetical protein
MYHYRQWHQPFPVREVYFVHTSREELDIRERQWAFRGEMQLQLKDNLP